MNAHRSASRHAAPAFTLVEMLIAVTLTAMMVAAVVDSVMRSSDFYQRHTGELDRAAAARQVLDTMTRDLSSAILRSGSDEVWLAADVLDSPGNSTRWIDGGKPANGSLNLSPAPATEEPEPAPRSTTNTKAQRGPPPLADYRFGQAGIWLRFFAMPEDRDFAKARNGTERKPGDVNALAYQLIRTGTPMGAGLMDKERIRYQLFRTIVDADQTFEQGYDITAYKQGKGGSNKLGSASTLRTPHPDTVLSEQVLDVGFIFRERNSKGTLVQAWPHRDSSLTPIKNKDKYRVPEDGKPTEIEMYVRVISRSGAQKLASRELGGLGAQDWWKEALQDSRLFRRVLPLRWDE